MGFIKFLGTAGARYVMAKQLRSSAGVYLELAGKRIVLDPGPGTLVRMATSRPRLEPEKLDAVVLSHLHIDHSNDVNVLFDAITEGAKKKKGTLFAPRQCLEGEDKVIFRYLKDAIARIEVLEEKGSYSLDDIQIQTSIRHLHGVETYGIKFKAEGKTISFLVDTRFFPELIESYAGSDILVVNVVMYEVKSKPHIMHLDVEDVKTIAKEIKPRLLIMTHFGMTMLRHKPWEIAAGLSDELGLEVKAASDGMKVEI